MTYATHPEYLGLLAAVLDRPDDDLPRLVIADWIEEHGYSERADIIRVECALNAAYRGDPVYPNGLPSLWSADMLGFADVYRGTLRGWLRHGPAVVRGHPVRQVVVTDKRPATGPPPRRFAGVYIWWRGRTLQDAEAPTWLPPEVVDHLVGEMLPSQIGIAPGKSLPSDDAARTALSAALLAWAKATDPEANPYKDLPDKPVGRVSRADVERLCRQGGLYSLGDLLIPDGYAVEWVDHLGDSARVIIPHNCPGVRRVVAVLLRDDLPTNYRPPIGRVILERTSGTPEWRREHEGYWTPFYAGRCDRCRVAYLAGVADELSQEVETALDELYLDLEAARAELDDPTS